MRILVAGGAGYIGSHVTRALLDAGYSVSVFDDFSTGLEANLFPDADVVRGSIRDTDLLKNTLKEGFDAVIHLAAFKAAGESMQHPGKYADNNICGTISLLNAMVETGVLRIVFSSSAAVYGEPQYVPVDEDHPTNPANFYGFTKLEIERIMAWYDDLTGLKSASLRYFNAAGYDTDGRIGGLERNPANLLPVIMEVATGVRDELLIFGDDYDTPDGTCIRDYVHVTDLANAHVAAVHYLFETQESIAVNLGSEQGLSVMEMLEVARTVTGQPIPSRVVDRRPGDPARLVASSSTASHSLSWDAVFSDPETLVRTTWEAYRKHMA